ncbi:hypothetical protein C7S16_2157 [Burkholderia thailandensis]|uniref:Uncharacterized protein n=1 Tax=Burkholderia thailandensis TaxID=57975 RepID=A0AAW9CX48_BURTH|nr:hypothetical protein [Burkholderia thailandensis]MDW9255490.1 hypothetical protein [Burkholderia thailandensis]
MRVVSLTPEQTIWASSSTMMPRRSRNSTSQHRLRPAAGKRRRHCRPTCSGGCTALLERLTPPMPPAYRDAFGRPSMRRSIRPSGRSSVRGARRPARRAARLTMAPTGGKSRPWITHASWRTSPART